MIKLLIVAGARPNFVKIAPLVRELVARKKTGHPLDYYLVHTGQHYDKNMSGSFFEQLQIPEPHENLNIGSGSHAYQTGRILIEFEKVLLAYDPTLIVVVGDVNSTMACTIVGKKLQYPVAHIEAGLRSYDLDMPEEINRIVTDAIADLFFTTTRAASQYLHERQADPAKVFFVGNIMIDSLKGNLARLEKPAFLRKNPGEKYVLLTMHRPSNVDHPEKFRAILDILLNNLKTGHKIVFPVHPRTRKVVNEMNLPDTVELVDPMPYLQFIYAVKEASLVVTDSGGLQEETTFLEKPCITYRTTTERPETVEIGTNELAVNNDDLLRFLKIFNDGKWKKGVIPELWDGNTAKRILDVIQSTDF